MSDNEDETNIFISEFELVKEIWITYKKDFKEKYIKLWEQIIEDNDVSNPEGNYFEKDNEEYIEGSISEIRIRKWIWKRKRGKEKILIDINGWPGDNEMGGIFLNDKMIFGNGDCNLGYVKESNEYRLERRMATFEHLRNYLCVPHDNENEYKHEECYRVFKFKGKQKL